VRQLTVVSTMSVADDRQWTKQTGASMKRVHMVTGLVVAGLCMGVMPAAVAGASSPPTSASGGGDYCSAHVALETAFSSDDSSAIQPAVEAATAAVPDELRDALHTAIELGGGEGALPPEFFEAYGKLALWIKDNCGFGSLDITAHEYAYEGVPAEVAAGPTVLTLTNNGQEYHEMVVFRRNEGADQPVEDILAMPDDQIGELLTPVGAAQAAPGTDGYAVLDLTPGDYIGLCFLPVGATPEMMEQMTEGSAPGEPMSSEPMGSDGAGAPEQHYQKGMIAEFTVVDGTTTTT
jgi:hypothetical protein